MRFHSSCARSARLLGAVLAVAGLAGSLAGAPSAGAESAAAAAAEGPVWKLVSTSEPTNLSPSASGNELVVTAVNVGGATDGSPVSIQDLLPAGLTAVGISGIDSYAHEGEEGEGIYRSTPLACTLATLTCTDSAVVEPGDPLVVRVKVAVEVASGASVVNRATVSGGGAEREASVSNPASVSSTPAGFGVAPGSVFTALSTRQAGAHPNVTTGFTLNTSAPQQVAAGPKDVQFNLPPGLVGNTVGLPRCTATEAKGENCRPDTVVGFATVFANTPSFEDQTAIVTPIFNIAPAPGEPAAFMFRVEFYPVRLDASVLSNGNYGVRVTAGNITQAGGDVSTYVTIWGVPADHEGRGLIGGYAENHTTPQEEAEEGNIQLGRYHQTYGGLTDDTRIPLLTNPTECSTPLVGSMETDAWHEQGVFHSSGPLETGVLRGCNLLSFSASMSMLPDTLAAGEPAGYSLALHVPQGNDPDGLAQPDVRKVVTTLPMGTVISPSAAWGLNACSDAQFGLHSGVASECPREAQVGTVQIKTPALEEAFSGEVYLAKPDCEPCTPEDAQDGTMVRLFVQAIAEGESGIVVKLEGKASVNQQTGQITATFDNNPQLPFSDFKLTLGGGSRAALANPRACGPATTTMGLTPWSTPFTSELSPTSTFEINQGCLGAQFAPSFVAGTTDIQAGEYTPFTVSFGRQDSDEFLNGLQMQMPPGLLGSLANVPLCGEPQAAQGTCGAESLIGHTQVLTGPGPDPFLVTGGQVFLTQGYRGAPFGLSIVVPAKAGPYTLAGTTGTGLVVVRAAINIDPSTAALTITSDPLPTIFDGIPLQLKVVNVTVDRPGFTFNPTNCSKLAITGTLTSKESAGVTVSSPYQATNCTGLGFKPRFLVSTSGRTSRANGASLDAKVIYPTGPKLANIARVKVSLPKQLPSRLTTLQKACPAATFEANPGSCPAASVVGIAKASTPILPVTLTGPVYFVSHGGEAFPNLIVVLQGYGVRVNLIGSTFISKTGITSSTFEHVPDVPITSFELYLPEGPYSALAANGNLCTKNLVMPTEFTAQNGAELHQSTKITVTNCQKTKNKKKAKSARAAAHNHRRHAHRATGRAGDAHSDRRQAR